MSKQSKRCNATQRKKVKGDELQALLDEHLQTDGKNVASIRGVIREELDIKLEAMETEMSSLVKSEVRTISDENKRHVEEYSAMKKVLHQKFIERTCKEEPKNNIFISGIPVAVQPEF